MDLKSLKQKISDKTGLSARMLTYIIIVICAIVLLAALNLTESKSEQSKEIAESGKEAIFAEDDDEYENKIRVELENVISQIEGVGKVSIMITFEGSSTNEYQTDMDISETDETSKTVIIGNKEALIKSVKKPAAVGVLVVCEGGDSLKVKEKVINAVSTVLNISSNRVYVTNRIKER